MSPENKADLFLRSVESMYLIDETSVCKDFLTSVEEGRVRIIENSIVFDLRLQVNSLDDRLVIFVPDNFSKEWCGNMHDTVIWNTVVDIVANVKHLSGMKLDSFNVLKLKA